MSNNYEERIEKLISEMTLEEKLGQLTQEYTTNDRIDELEKLAEKGELGSCILAYSAMAGSDEQESLYLSGLNKIQKAAMEKRSNELDEALRVKRSNTRQSKGSKSN